MVENIPKSNGTVCIKTSEYLDLIRKNSSCNSVPLESGDKFGKNDVAQILVGTFVIASGTLLSQGKEISLISGLLVFLVLLVVAGTIFSIIGARDSMMKRIWVSVTVLFFISLMIDYLINNHVDLGKVFLHTGTALPIAAGIDAIRE